jgi:hypothetical protein
MTAQLWLLIHWSFSTTKTTCPFKHEPVFLSFMEPRNRFQGMNSASLCSLVGRYNNPIPYWFLATIDCLQIPVADRASISWFPTAWLHRWSWDTELFIGLCSIAGWLTTIKLFSYTVPTSNQSSFSRSIRSHRGVGPENRDFLDLKWQRAKPVPFVGPKKSRFSAPTHSNGPQND